MGTSIGAATDWLVANFTTAVATANPAAVVADNEPTKQAPAYVSVGRTLPQDANGVAGSQVPLVMGLNKREEEYAIPCFAQATAPGPSQKAARDAAILLFDTCAHVVAADPTLGGVLLDGRCAWIDNIRMVQTDTSREPGALQVATIAFDVHCRNHYVP